jgi:dihydropyrimidine dehydrogenase (NAD+) subunit PreA
MNLSVYYLGKRFDNPFVLASGPPTANGEMIARAFEAGWAGAVIKTLIWEPVKNLQNRFASNRLGREIIAFKNIELLSEQPPDVWYKEIRTLKKNYPDKIVIGSIMGDAKSSEQWIMLALGCQEAGCDLIELNYSCPHGYPEKGKGSAIGQNAEFASRITQWMKSDKRITTPLVPKLTAATADISYIGETVAQSGADGICAINTFPSLMEFMLLGAPIVQVCTAVMLKGISIISKMKDQLSHFMKWHRFSKIHDFIGLGATSIRLYSELDPTYQVKAIVHEDKCNGCQICFISCRDGGYQAIEMQKKLAFIVDNKCMGCSLCFQVCPSNAISIVER